MVLALSCPRYGLERLKRVQDNLHTHAHKSAMQKVTLVSVSKRLGSTPTWRAEKRVQGLVFQALWLILAIGILTASARRLRFYLDHSTLIMHEGSWC